MNIYEKIQAVSLDVKNISKNMTVGGGAYSYKAVSDLDVTLAVKEAEAKHGIVSIPIKQELIKSEVYRSTKKESYNGRDTEKETFTYVDDIKMTVRIINLENPDEFIDIETYGKGIDTGDKGFGKASTYARKYALLNAYKIATGDDPDKDASPEDGNHGKPVTPEPKQAQVKPVAETKDPEAAAKKRAAIEVQMAQSVAALDTIYANYKQFHGNEGFEKLVNGKKIQLVNLENNPLNL